MTFYEVNQSFQAFLLSASVCFLIWVRVGTLLTYFQQEEYNPARYARAFFRIRLFDLRASAVLLVLSVAIGPLFPKVVKWVFPFLAAAFILIVAWRESRHGYKKPLILTERARRIRGLAVVLSVGLVALSRGGSFALFFIVQFLPLVMILANAVLFPLQRRINRRYIENAKQKLERMDPIRIGITGSFGKTTVKYIFSEILALSGQVFYSRGSINTELGLTRHIRERLQWGHRYFVAEMGAYAVGSISRLCSFVRPTYGIVTAVGEAHIERFGSVEQTALAKSELVASVCKAGGHVVLNEDILKFEAFRELYALYKSQITTVGFGIEANVAIEESTFAEGSWKVILRGRGNMIDFRLNYRIPLLGAHNVMNSALAAVMAHKIDPSITGRIPLAMAGVEQIPHRLQKREGVASPLILDDTFNSNESGFKNAVRVLSQLAAERGGQSILVTPGVVELGPEHDSVHEELGLFCKGRCDRVYVIGPSRMKAFIMGLRGAGVEYFPVATLSEARRSLFESGEVSDRDVILYENDLPDLLEEKRVL